MGMKTVAGKMGFINAQSFERSFPIDCDVSPAPLNREKQDQGIEILIERTCGLPINEENHSKTIRKQNNLKARQSEAEFLNVQ